MTKFDFDKTYFSPTATLDCGQTFRFYPFKKGFLVLSSSKACYVYEDGAKTVVESDYPDYFYNYFDLGKDYSVAYERAKSYNIPLLSKSADFGKGIRILNQDKEETVFSFVISQNNNIPRIKSIIEKLCERLGKKHSFLGKDYYSFPTTATLAEQTPEFFKALGAGYRDVFLSGIAKEINANGISYLNGLDAKELKQKLLKFKGIGNKVADCICLFGFGKTEAFPVDTWIEKIYKEDFGGTETDRKKINEFFCGKFGEYSGIIQQYLFYGKRANL